MLAIEGEKINFWEEELVDGSRRRFFLVSAGGNFVFSDIYLSRASVSRIERGEQDWEGF